MSVTRRVFLQRIAQAGGYAAAFASMQALGLMPEVGASPLPQMAADFGRGKKVVILGGGIAGLVSAYELRKAGFECVILEARERPGGRSWSVRKGSKVEFTDGTVQECTWDEGYLNPGPARIPSIHTHLLNYCHELGVPLEVEVNTSRSALMQSPLLNGGKAVEQRQVVHDTRGYLAELIAKSIHQNTLDQELSAVDLTRLNDFVKGFGDLDANGRYTGSTRAGFTVLPGAGLTKEVIHKPLPFKDLLAADFSTGELYEEQIDWQATMFQPVGGMDRIPYGFARVIPEGVIEYKAVVEEIATGDGGVTIAYSKGGVRQTVKGDFCICTMPVSVLAKTKNNFSEATKKAFLGMPMTALYKIAWESPRFWEKENNIYGGISFLRSSPVDVVWYPTDRMFSAKGVLVAGFSLERRESPVPVAAGADATVATPFGALPSTEAKLAASRAAVELLHPGRGALLEKPIYVSWAKIPYSLGCFANNNSHAATAQVAYEQLDKNEGRTYFAGDYLSHLVGWQEGALLSAHHAIERIAGAVKG
jgi:monoamine oxidase